MHKGLPFVLLAFVIAALVVPVSYALSLTPPLPEPDRAPVVWSSISIMTNASLASSGVRMAPRRTPVPEPPDRLRLFVAGTALIGVATLARRGRRDRPDHARSPEH
jgi:hypothetical protein